MKIGKGVEWAAHACTLLAGLPSDKSLPKEALAEFLGVPAPYLAKQMQALSRAGIVGAHKGAAGGYRLAKPIDAINLWDITAAVEGTKSSFRCTEIRQNGPCAMTTSECTNKCHIASAFHEAEMAYRKVLKQTSLKALALNGANDMNEATKVDVLHWLDFHSTTPLKKPTHK